MIPTAETSISDPKVFEYSSARITKYIIIGLNTARAFSMTFVNRLQNRLGRLTISCHDSTPISRHRS